MVENEVNSIEKSSEKPELDLNTDTSIEVHVTCVWQQ